MTEAFEVLSLLVFLSAALALVLLEQIRVIQRQRVGVARRWTSNIGLFLIGNLFTGVVIPIGVYAFAQQQPPGPLARLDLPFAAQLLLTFLLLDFWRYWEHRLFHQVPLLWRLHLVHHSDTQVDVTTSERHHPLEVLLGTAVTMALIAVLGLPAPAVGLYLLTATTVALYSHANLRLPAALARPLNALFVTSSVHAVHHSDVREQTDSNYGSVLTLWDRCFGTYSDPENTKIARFGLAYFHRPPDTGLAGVLRQPFVFRRDLDYPARENAPVETVMDLIAGRWRSFSAMPQSTRDAIVGGITGCLLVVLAMWPTVVQLTAQWRIEPYQYAWLVLPMVVYLLGWHHRSAGLRVAPRPDFTGLFVVFIAAVCWGGATLTNIDVGRQFALILALQGVAMSALGWQAYWRLFPTLALMFLMIPSGDVLQPTLRLLTLKAIELFTVVAGLPHSVDGFVIFVGTHRYIVADECSGLAYVTLAIFLGYSFGVLLYRSIVKIAALALFGAFLGIVCNAIRVNAIVLIDWVRGSQMDLTAHGSIQWLALLVALGLLFFVLSRLKAEPAAGPLTVAPAPALAIRRVAPIVAGMSVLLIAGCAAGLTANEPGLPHGMQAGAFPQKMSQWELTRSEQVWAVDPDSHTESISLTYGHDGREMRVVIVESLLPDAKLPESKLRPHDPGVWREKQVQKETGCVPSGCIPLLHSTWQRDKSSQQRHVYYAYSLGDFSTSSRLALRVAHGWHRLTGGRDTPRLVGFVFEDTIADRDELAAAFRLLHFGMKAPRQG